MDDDLADLIGQLDRDLAPLRWERGLVAILDEVEATEDPPPPSSARGIDLAEKHRDIRCLTGKFGLRACITNGWDFEELLSDVYLKLATSNLSEHPFDPTRAKLSTYVVLAIRSVIVNKWRRQTKRGHCRHVAIDDPECLLQLRTSDDIDGTLDAARAWSRAEDEEPELVEALVRHEGHVHPARAELHVDYRRMHRLRGEMVAALGG